jgi:hypothetical protein
MSNSFIQIWQTRAIDDRVRRVINNFVKDQKLQRIYIQAPLKNRGMWIPDIEKEMQSYRIHSSHICYN